MIFLNQLLSNKSESNTVILSKIKKQTVVSSSEEIVSTLPYHVFDGCAVVYQNELHLMGTGYSVSEGKNHYKWDGSTWTSISTLPFRLNRGVSVVYNDEIHLFGNQSYHYKWDGSTWTYVGSLPRKITDTYSVIVHNNEIHLISKENGTRHYKFDGTRWTEVSTPPTLNSFRMVSYKNKIHVLGSGSGYVDHYTWDGSTWEKLADLPYDFRDGVAIVYNDELHIIGTANSDHCCDHYKWVDDTTWVLIGTVSLKVLCAASVVYNGGINILGGAGDASTIIRHSMIAEGVSITDCISIHSKNSNVYSTNFIESGDHFTIPIDTMGSDGTHIFVYNKDNTKLLYTNQTITYNQDTSKYEIYGYFPTTLKGTTVPITSSGWQTLQLDTPNLFK